MGTWEQPHGAKGTLGIFLFPCEKPISKKKRNKQTKEDWALLAGGEVTQGTHTDAGSVLKEEVKVLVWCLIPKLITSAGDKGKSPCSSPGRALCAPLHRG